MPSASDGVPRPARFYTRPTCSLCDRAYSVLERLAGEGLLTIERIDIQSSPALTERFGHTIPVVELSSGEIFQGRISEFRLRRALQSER